MSKRMLLTAITLVAPLLILLGWQLASAQSESFYFPPLSEILARFGELLAGGTFGEHVLPSLQRMLLGYLIAVVLGLVVGVSLGMSRTANSVVGPLIEFLRAVPSVVLIPFGIVVFGADTAMKVFVIALGCSFPVILNAIDGVRSVDSTLVDVSRTFGFSRSEVLWRVVLPSASPRIFAGMRTSLGLALILMVVSEMVASTNGIGYFILEAQRLFEVLDMWSGVIMLGVLGYLINTILVLAERRILAWHRGYRASVLGQVTAEPRTRRNGMFRRTEASPVGAADPVKQER